MKELYIPVTTVIIKRNKSKDSKYMLMPYIIKFTIYVKLVNIKQDLKRFLENI